MAGDALGSLQVWRGESRELEGRRWYTGRLRLPVFIERRMLGRCEFVQVGLFVSECAAVALPTCAQVCQQPPPSARSGYSISDMISAHWF